MFIRAERLLIAVLVFVLLDSRARNLNVVSLIAAIVDVLC